MLTTLLYYYYYLCAPLPIQVREVSGVGRDSDKYIRVLKHHGIGNASRRGRFEGGGVIAKKVLSSTYIFKRYVWPTRRE